MKCFACGYENHPVTWWMYNDTDSAFFKEAGRGKFREFVKIFACPKCGTLKIEA